jgi:hypothetical protein
MDHLGLGVLLAFQPHIIIPHCRARQKVAPAEARAVPKKLIAANNAPGCLSFG